VDGASEEEAVVALAGLYTGAAEPFPPRRPEKTAISSWVVIGSVWIWIPLCFVWLRRRFVLLIFCNWCSVVLVLMREENVSSSENQ
jgi:hypothetical protein